MKTSIFDMTFTSHPASIFDMTFTLPPMVEMTVMVEMTYWMLCCHSFRGPGDVCCGDC